MSTAEKIYEKVQGLPEATQHALLQVLESLVPGGTPAPAPAPKAGSAKGFIEIAPDFDEPLEDFKPYMK